MQTILVFDDLRAFVVVAQSQSISQAAAKLDLAQPALSRRLMRIEKCVGTRLIDRKSRGITLTQEGRTFFKDAQVAVSAVVTMEKNLPSFRHNH